MLAQVHEAIVVPVVVLDKPKADGSYNVKVLGAPISNCYRAA